MPYCTKCGNQVGNTDVFCGKCGARQQTTPPPATTQFLNNLSPRTAKLLCYLPVVGWIPSIIVLASPRFQHMRDIRFHGFQGLYLFVVWLIVDWGITPVMFLPGGGFQAHVFRTALQLAVLVAWIFMLVKTSQGEDYHLPIVGELAEKSLSEQKAR